MSIMPIIIKGAFDTYKASQVEENHLNPRGSRKTQRTHERVDTVEISLEGKYKQILEDSMLEIVNRNSAKK